jgi:GTP-binding protein
MAKLPRVLIVGRPNVGKSTLVNRILKKKRAITLDEPGVTRDISTHEVVWRGKPFVLMDSGGVMFQNSSDFDFQESIDEIVLNTLESVDYIIFLVDSRDGVHPLDKEVGKKLQPYKDKVVVAVNKIDNPDLIDADKAPFYQLGFGEPFAVSAHHGMGLQELLAYVLSSVPKKYDEDVEDTGVEYKVSFLGRPNAGKSSLINAITNDERMIVSDIAGTTRDAVDVYFNYHGKKYVITDTAGLRKKSKVDDSIEFYSTVRTRKALEESDLVVIVVDITRGLSRQDKRIIADVVEAQKNMILFVNKWDTTERTDQLQKDFSHILQAELPVLENYPIIFGSATERVHLGSLLETIPQVIERGEMRIQTADLNKFVEHVVKRNPPPAKSGKRVNVLYGSQVSAHPPVFVFFVNHLEYVGDEYYRFLERRLRQYFGGFIGNTVVLRFKQRKQDSSRRFSR